MYILCCRLWAEDLHGLSSASLTLPGRELRVLFSTRGDPVAGRWGGRDAFHCMAFYTTWTVVHGHVSSTRKKPSKLQRTENIKLEGENNVENTKAQSLMCVWCRNGTTQRTFKRFPAITVRCVLSLERCVSVLSRNRSCFSSKEVTQNDDLGFRKLSCSSCFGQLWQQRAAR